MASRLIFGLGSLHRLTFTSQRQRVIKEATDIGFRAFDVAPAYGNGLCEAELGLALAKQRSEVTIATKYGIPMPLYGSSSRSLFAIVRAADKYLNPFYNKRYERRWFEPAYLQESLEGSLRRLRTDYVDLFLIHEPLAPIPILLLEDIAEVVGKMKQRGKIRAFGIAGPIGRIEATVRHPAMEAIQAPLPDLRGDMVPRGRKLIAYSVLKCYKKEREGRSHFASFVSDVLREDPALNLILASTRLSTLRSFKELF